MGEFKRVLASCWKCMRREAYIHLYEDGEVDPQLCRSCKRAHNKALKNWNESTSDYRSDRSYYEHNIELSDELANRISYEKWLEENS